MRTKICTSIEQSKILIELGIDRKTSDMYYWCGEDLRIGGHKAQNDEFDISAWSLSALFKMMPFQIPEDNKRYRFRQWKRYNSQGETYCFEYVSDIGTTLYETYAWNDPIDSAFEMVCWLKENNKI